MSLAVHCATSPNVSTGHPDNSVLRAQLGASPRVDRGAVPVEVTVQPRETPPEEGSFRLECVYAAGIAPEAFWSLPTTVRHLSFTLSPGSPAKAIGRQHQPEMFE